MKHRFSLSCIVFIVCFLALPEQFCPVRWTEKVGYHVPLSA